jgi:hypothetical protein
MGLIGGLMVSWQADEGRTTVECTSVLGQVAGKRLPLACKSPPECLQVGGWCLMEPATVNGGVFGVKHWGLLF